MPIFLLLLALLTAAYVVGLLMLRHGIARAASIKPARDLPSVTVIVCARNEAANLPHLLPALAAQNYPHEKLELCLVDDRSSDSTSTCMQEFVQQHAHARYFRITDLQPNFAPKKRALDYAIRNSTGDIIVLTDADAVPGPDWVREMIGGFDATTAMVCGYSPYYPRHGLWQKILALEYFSLAAVAAGSIGMGRPLTCTGSNLAYRRTAFNAVHGFAGIAHWISGDDDLLLHKMYEQNAGPITFVGHAASHVPVRPPETWSAFQAQRTRYASKGRHYKISVTLALVAIYVLNLLLCVGMLALCAGATRLFLGTLCLGVIKAGFEFSYLKRAAAWFQEESLLRYFPLAAVLHPFYIIYFSTRAQLAGFTWRGENYAAQMR